jgi:hypothetical protein
MQHHSAPPLAARWVPQTAWPLAPLLGWHELVLAGATALV